MIDYEASIQRVYRHTENGAADKAALECLRIARNLRDFVNIFVLQRVLASDPSQFRQAFAEDTESLNQEAKKYVWDTSLRLDREMRTLPFDAFLDEPEGSRNTVGVGIGEIDDQIAFIQDHVARLAVPPGLTPDVTLSHSRAIGMVRKNCSLQLQGLRKFRQRVVTFCHNYAIKIERQLASQAKPVTFLHGAQTQVNNYFKDHCEEVYVKLQKASQLVDSIDPEDHSNLLASVRRAIKSAADYFYPPVAELVDCADGKQRTLGEDQYLNRLHEFLARQFENSTSRDLLKAEVDQLSVFARRLNEMSSKGVHAGVTPNEAKQGLIGLYLFLFNVISKLQYAEPAEQA